MAEIKDEQLVSQYLRGDVAALDILVNRYLKLVYGFICQRLGTVSEVEDLTQEVFIKMLKSLKSFDKQRSFKAWIFIIARNTIIDYSRRKKMAPFSAFETETGANFIFETLADGSPLASELFDEHRSQTQLLGAVAKLPVQHRQILQFYVNNGLNFREIAKLLGESINTVKSRYRRAIIGLKKIIAQ